MARYLEKPDTTKHCENGAGNGLRYGVSSMQGWRTTMEDHHTTLTTLPCSSQRTTMEDHHTTLTTLPHSERTTMEDHHTTLTTLPCSSQRTTMEDHHTTLTTLPHSERTTMEDHHTTLTTLPHIERTTMEDHHTTLTTLPCSSQRTTMEDHHTTLTTLPHSERTTMEDHHTTLTTLPHIERTTMEDHHTTLTTLPHSERTTMEDHHTTLTTLQHSERTTMEDLHTTVTTLPCSSQRTTMEDHHTTLTTLPHSERTTMEDHHTTLTTLPHSERTTMEDHHTTLTTLPHSEQWSYFGVYDGHGGKHVGDVVSKHCSHSLTHHITNTEEFLSGQSSVTAGEQRRLVTEGIRKGFLSCDEELRTVGKLSKGANSGSTATTLMVSKDHMYFANCGDSRGVLFSDGRCKFATVDHVPDNPVEKTRIEAAGGVVINGSINGNLGVSRALGDFQFKTAMEKGPCEQQVMFCRYTFMPKTS